MMNMVGQEMQRQLRKPLKITWYLKIILELVIVLK